MFEGKKLKEVLVKAIESLPEEKQKDFVKEIMEIVQQACQETGLDILIQNTDVVIDPLVGSKSKEDFINFLKKHSLAIEEIEKQVEEEGGDKRDFDEKKVGDSVVIVDDFATHYMYEYETKEQVGEKGESLLNTPAIVVETGQEFTFNCGNCDQLHTSELVIYFPSEEKKYYIANDLVKLI